MVDSNRELIGQVLLGKLRVIRLLGQGGMGSVFEVEHLHTRHRRALKLLPRRFAREEDVVRFLRQASVAAAAQSPFIVDTYDAGQLEDGTAFVLMEKLEGCTLAQRLTLSPLDPEEVARIGVETSLGLSSAHAQGIVHRDLKPDNIFLANDSMDGELGREDASNRNHARVKILDFGISKFARAWDSAGSLTEDRAVMGTPHYMAPEQASNTKQVDLRADVYALGVVLYECLSGKRPFTADNFPELVLQIHQGSCRPLSSVAPSVDPEFTALVSRAMHREPEQRLESAEALARALLKFCAQEVRERYSARLGREDASSSRRWPQQEQTRSWPGKLRAAIHHAWTPALFALTALGAGLVWVFAVPSRGSVVDDSLANNRSRSKQSASVQAGSNQPTFDYTMARSHYIQADNRSCLEFLDWTRAPKNLKPDQALRAQVLQAACLYAAGRIQDAKRSIASSELVNGGTNQRVKPYLAQTTPEFQGFFAIHARNASDRGPEHVRTQDKPSARRTTHKRETRPSVSAMLDLDPYGQEL